MKLSGVGGVKEGEKEQNDLSGLERTLSNDLSAHVREYSALVVPECPVMSWQPGRTAPFWSRSSMSGCVSPSKRLQHPHTGAGLCLGKVGGRVNYLERLTSLLGELGSVPRSRYLQL